MILNIKYIFTTTVLLFFIFMVTFIIIFTFTIVFYNYSYLYNYINLKNNKCEICKNFSFITVLNLQCKISLVIDARKCFTTGCRCVLSKRTHFVIMLTKENTTLNQNSDRRKMKQECLDHLICILHNINKHNVKPTKTIVNLRKKNTDIELPKSAKVLKSYHVIKNVRSTFMLRSNFLPLKHKGQ